MTHRANRQRGASVLEFALVMPIISLAMVATLDIARAAWIRHSVTDVAAEAARYATVHSDTSDEPTNARKLVEKTKQLARPLDPELLTVSTTWSPDNRRGSKVRVDVAYAFVPLTPLPSLKTMTLRASAQRVITY